MPTAATVALIAVVLANAAVTSLGVGELSPAKTWSNRAGAGLLDDLAHDQTEPRPSSVTGLVASPR